MNAHARARMYIRMSPCQVIQKFHIESDRSCNVNSVRCTLSAHRESVGQLSSRRRQRLCMIIAAGKEIMPIDLYYTPISSPCRAVLLTAEAIGLALNLKEINLFTGDHLKPEYEQLNPQKTVPFLVDGDYKLTESRAIMSYLVDQYGKNVRLNPQTAIGRALVNHRLHFDIGTLYKAMKDYYYPVIFGNAETYNPDDYKKIEAAFQVLNEFLEDQDYAVGRNLTIADLALAATVSTSEIFGFEVHKYANVAKWMDRIKMSAPGYRKANSDGLEMLKKFIEESRKE